MLQKKQLLILFFIALNCASVFAFNPLQEPENNKQFDADFKERYSGRKYNYEGKDVVNKTHTGNGEYADYNDKDVKVEEENNKTDSGLNLGFISWIFIILLIVAVLYLIFILLNEGGSGLFSSRQNQKITDYDKITSENIENADIKSLIANAENNNDYRLAIRYYYLLILKRLTVNNYIKFEEDKTNADYLNEIDAQPFSEDFSYISYLYNYIWYGEFAVNAGQYNKAKDNFNNLLSKVK